MFSEIHAQIEAEKLEKVLLKVRMPWWIWAYPFARIFIYPMYEDACSEAWMEENPKLQKFYKPLKYWWRKR